MATVKSSIAPVEVHLGHARHPAAEVEAGAARLQRDRAVEVREGRGVLAEREHRRAVGDVQPDVVGIHLQRLGESRRRLVELGLGEQPLPFRDQIVDIHVRIPPVCCDNGTTSPRRPRPGACAREGVAQPAKSRATRSFTRSNAPVTSSRPISIITTPAVIWTGRSQRPLRLMTRNE